MTDPSPTPPKERTVRSGDSPKVDHAPSDDVEAVRDLLQRAGAGRATLEAFARIVAHAEALSRENEELRRELGR